MGFLGSMYWSPVLAVEDTDTPGDKRWEINFGASGARSMSGWTIGGPELDLNYGWGEHTQLMAAVAWITQTKAGVQNQSGLGAGIIGGKWRFIDQERAGFSMSTFPQYSANLDHDAEGRGIVEPGSRFLLPLTVGYKVGNLGVYGEVSRMFANVAPNESAYGLKLLHQCATGLECRLEIKRMHVPQAASQTLVSAGFKWNLTESFLLRAGIGREFGPREDGQENLQVQLGIQILR
jgi:hypothetical protein